MLHDAWWLGVAWRIVVGCCMLHGGWVLHGAWWLHGIGVRFSKVVHTNIVYFLKRTGFAFCNFN